MRNIPIHDKIRTMTIREPGIKVQTKNENAYYFIEWSPLRLAERWDISTRVPSIAGIYEIYWMDDHNHLRLLSIGCTYYGGLRSELRRLTDPELTQDLAAKKILEDKEIWYRYAPTNSKNVMADVVWFFRSIYFPENPGVESSGLYKNVHIKESEPNKLIWVP